MATNDAEPLTTAELDALDALNRARTPGPVDVLTWPGDGRGMAVCEIDDQIVRAMVMGRAPATADARAIAAALNALPALLAEVRASRAAAVEVRAVAAALAEHDACLACGIEDQEDSCLYHESHELSARLLAALDGKGASK